MLLILSDLTGKRSGYRIAIHIKHIERKPMQRIFHTPEGFRDIYGRECARKDLLKDKIRTVMHSYGYEDIETPSVEYFEVFSNEVGTIPSKDLYKFFDREGNTLVLRPDFTPSVSRACASFFAPDREPACLCYSGNAFINLRSFSGSLKETTQMGVERIGDDSCEADAEILAMTIECLIRCGLSDFQVSVGQVDYFKSLLHEVNLSPETEERLRTAISEKNTFGVEAILEEEDVPRAIREAFVALPHMFGQTSVLAKARQLCSHPDAQAAVSRLEEIYEILKIYGYEKYISFDLSMLSKYQYYTGIIFQAYTYGTGEPIVKGGRYDNLLRHFGKDAPSIGFALMVDSLYLALMSQKRPMDEPGEPVKLKAGKENREEMIKEAMALRKSGQKVRLIFDRQGENGCET